MYGMGNQLSKQNPDNYHKHTDKRNSGLRGVNVKVPHQFPSCN